MKHVVSVGDTTVGEDVAAVGAACLVLDRLLSPRPSTLLIAEAVGVTDQNGAMASA